MQQAPEAFGKLKQFEQYQAYRMARSWASGRLKKQTAKPGLAILGRPTNALDTDPKCQGQTKHASIQVGEQMALAALTSEYLVLDLAGIKKVAPYLGRS